MTMNRTILLTLDYELFFAKSGTAEKSIIEPTNKLIEVLKELRIPATFFVDTMYLAALQSSHDTKNQRTFSFIKNQLQEIIKSGSRIELHLHPHWIDAAYGDGLWEFPTLKHYKLSSLTSEQLEAAFSEGIKILHDIAREVYPNYQVACFRAGGWCIEPFSIIKSLMEKHNIYADSSVCPGLYMNGSIHKIDYRDIKMSSFYRFSGNVRSCEINGKFLEIPVNGFVVNAWDRFLWLLKSRIFYNDSVIWGDGVGIPSIYNQGRLNKFIALLKNESYYSQFSLDNYVDKKLLNKIMKATSYTLITFVAHPKTITKSSLDAIRYFKSKGYAFSTLQKVANENIQNI